MVSRGASTKEGLHLDIARRPTAIRGIAVPDAVFKGGVRGRNNNGGREGLDRGVQPLSGGRGADGGCGRVGIVLIVAGPGGRRIAASRGRGVIAIPRNGRRHRRVHGRRRAAAERRFPAERAERCGGLACRGTQQQNDQQPCKGFTQYHPINTLIRNNYHFNYPVLCVLSSQIVLPPDGRRPAGRAFYRGGASGSA